MRVTVTGTSGFVGQNLQKYLENNGIDVLPISLRNEWKSKIDGNSNVIIHLAGKAHDTNNTSNEEEYFKINRDLTIDVFNFFLKSEVSDFIFFSSVKAVADSVEDILTEDVIGNPKTPYGKSKYEAEQYLVSQKLPQNKRLFIIRPSMIHGAGNKGNLNLLYKIVAKGVPWPLGAFHNQRSFVSINNLSFIIHQLLINKNIESGVYNVADDKPLSTNELITLMSKALGKKPKILSVSKNLITKLASLGDVLRLPLNSERLKKLTENYVVSNQKVKQVLKINTLPLSAEEGILKTIKSFKNK